MPIDNPIFFAQTREHSQVELDAICNKTNINICLIASGGDMLCDIASRYLSVSQIDVIDCNMNQIYLSKLKLALIQKYCGKFNIDFLTNGFKFFDKSNMLCCQIMIKDLFFSNLLDSETHNYWIDNICLLEEGVNQNGRFEKLFQKLNKGPIDKYFSHQYLTKVFGENATKYSMSKSFTEHFQGILKKYQKDCPDPINNYFHYQILNNCYPKNGDLPLYLSIGEPIKINYPIIFHQDNMLDFLKKQSDSKYDLIHLSNIIDWLDPKMLCDLLDEVGRTLIISGKATLRRLNSDTILVNFLETDYLANGKYQFKYSIGYDKSNFYSEVIVLEKIEK